MLSVEDLTCGYNSKPILNNITLTLSKREILGIIGPNGSGKTTLLRAISRIIKPMKGRIFFNRKELNKMPSGELACSMAVVSQDTNSALMTVEEFVALGRIPHYKKLQFFDSKKDIDVINKAMKLTGILNSRKTLLSELSGGEKQLVYIAKALAQEPTLLLLDEPTNHLDIGHQAAILNLLAKLNKQSEITIIMVLHDLNLAGQYCTNLALINKGSIHRLGKPQEVLTEKTITEVYQTKSVYAVNTPFSPVPCFFCKIGANNISTVHKMKS